MRASLATATLAMGLLPLLSACGAGAVAGFIAGTSSGDPQSPRAAPALVVSVASGPLRLPLQAVTRTVDINNYELPVGAGFSVELRALGVVSPLAAVVQRSTAGLTKILFQDSHKEIGEAALKRPAGAKADVNATLWVLVDGEPVAPAIPYTLRREREVQVESSAANEFASVIGNSRVRLRVSGYPGEEQLQNLLIQHATRATPITPIAGFVQKISGAEEFFVDIVPPRVPAPGRMLLVGVDDDGGTWPEVTSIYYRPELIGVSPAFGSGEGGARLTLVGQGMVPLQYLGATPVPNFAKVTIRFRKGGRIIEVPGTAIQASTSSSFDLLAPPSPDGRPGAAAVAVVTELEDGVIAEHELSDVFVYRRPRPNFGPRGALLTAAPAADTPIGQGGGIDDWAVIHDVGGVPHYDLLFSEGNGMLSSAGRVAPAALPGMALARVPIDVCAGDYDNDGDEDLIVINRNVNRSASHTILESRSPPEVPLHLVPSTIDFIGEAALGRGGDLDGDGRDDLVVLQALGSGGATSIFYSRVAAGVWSFEPALPDPRITVQAPFDTLEIADVDDDGNQDLVMARGGVEMRLTVAYGDGRGGFEEVIATPVRVPGYVPGTASRAVGIHPLTGSGAAKTLGLVLEGIDASVSTRPTIVVLSPDTARSYRSPLVEEVFSLLGAKEIVASDAGDLDGDQVGEIVVATTDGSIPQLLRVLRWDGARISEVSGAVERTAEPLRGLRQVRVRTAAEPTPQSSARVMGVFVQHQQITTVGPEERVSVWVADPGPPLLLRAPDSALIEPTAIYGLALGNFSGDAVDPNDPSRTALEVMQLTAAGYRWSGNDGVGALSRRGEFGASALVPGTIVRVPADAARSTDAVACLLENGFVSFLLPDSGPVPSSRSLRSYVPGAANWELDPRSRLMAADVDRDGLTDLVVLLALQDPVSASNSAFCIALLRGSGDSGLATFPFHLPDALQSAIPEFTAGALGDFAQGTSALELAVAVRGAPPGTGTPRIDFYRHEPGGPSPTDDLLVPSFSSTALSALTTGDQPEALSAGDFDRNGQDDLAVASTDVLRVFLNDGSFDAAKPQEVHLAAFQPNLNTAVLPPGVPRHVLVGDVNGDRALDAVVVTEEPGPDYEVAVLDNSGTGDFSLIGVLSEIRTGNEVQIVGPPQLRGVPLFPAMGDLNFDGVPDLVLGWESAGGADRNLRVLFGAAR